MNSIAARVMSVSVAAGLILKGPSAPAEIGPGSRRCCAAQTAANARQCRNQKRAIERGGYVPIEITVLDQIAVTPTVTAASSGSGSRRCRFHPRLPRWVVLLISWWRRGQDLTPIWKSGGGERQSGPYGGRLFERVQHPHVETGEVPHVASNNSQIVHESRCRNHGVFVAVLDWRCMSLAHRRKHTASIASTL
jgi:hypothetical protein